MFTPVPRRLRLHVTPHLYAQRSNMLPLLGPLILQRIVINWNRSSDVLLGLHDVTGTREQPAWQLCWTTWSGRHWRLGVRNNPRLTMFYRMQHNMVSISPADYLAPVQSSWSRRSGHDQMYQVPYARTDVYKYSFFPATVRTWNALPASMIQSGTLSSFKAGISDHYGHWPTSRDHRPPVRDTRPSRTALYWKMKMKQTWLKLKMQISSQVTCINSLFKSSPTNLIKILKNCNGTIGGCPPPLRPKIWTQSGKSRLP